MNIGAILMSINPVVDEIVVMIVTFLIQKRVQVTQKVKTWKDFCNCFLNLSLLNTNYRDDRKGEK